MDIEISDIKDAEGKVINQIATITENIPEITKFSKDQILQKKEILTAKKTEIEAEITKLDTILAEF